MTLPLLRPDWPAPANVRAAMTTRAGGVSVGPYASLNLGAGVSDDPAAVSENRRRVSVALNLPGEPNWLKQVHGTAVIRIFPPPPAGGGRGRGDPEADASFTTERGVVCAVMAADCLPVLFCDDAGTVVAAAHVGWRGLAAGVIESTVRALPVKPPTLMAWLGAAIGPESFEVGVEVREAFVSRDVRAADCFTPLPSGAGDALEAHRPPALVLGAAGEAARSAGEGEPKYLADLYGLARQRLESAGVTRVYSGGRCTLREPQHFFSHRRDGRCGRMAALVWLA